MKQKEDRARRVAEGAMVLVAKKGIDAVSISSVSRASGVSRAWIYKYVGKGRDELFTLMVKSFTDLLGELSKPRPAAGREEWIEARMEGTSRLLQDAARYPLALHAYYRFHSDRSPLFERILEGEREYVRVLGGETARALRVSVREAEAFAEIFTTFRMALAHRWVTTPSFRGIGEAEVMGWVRKFLESWAPGATRTGSSASPR